MRELVISIQADLSSATASLDRAADLAGPLGSRTATIGQIVSTGLTVPMAALAAAADRMMSDSGAAYRRFLVGMGGQTADADRMYRAWQEARRVVPDSQGQLADALVTLTRRMGGNAEAAGALMPAVAGLARAAGTDMAGAAQIAADVMSRWRLSGSGTADLLAQVTAECQRSGGSALDLLSTLQDSAGLFESLRMSAGDAVGFLGRMRVAGLDAEQVTTALSRAVRTLVDPGKTPKVAGATDQARRLEDSIGSLTAAVRSARADPAESVDPNVGRELDALAAILGDLSGLRIALDQARDGGSLPVGSLDRLRAASRALASHVPALSSLLAKAHGPLKTALDRVLTAISREGSATEAFVARIDADAAALASLRGPNTGDARTLLDRAMEEIRRLKSGPEAIAAACRLFGRSGVQIAHAIRVGGLSLSGVRTPLSAIEAARERFSTGMMKLGESLTLLSQRLQVALEPVCLRIQAMLREREASRAERFTAAVTSLLGEWDRLSPWWQQTIIEVGAALAAAGPALVMIGYGISVVARIVRDVLGILRAGWRLAVAVGNVVVRFRRVAALLLGPVVSGLSWAGRAILAACRVWPVVAALFASGLALAPLALALGAAVATWLASIPRVRAATSALSVSILSAWRHAVAMAREGGAMIDSNVQTAITGLGGAARRTGNALERAMRTGGAELVSGFAVAFRSIRRRLTRLLGFVFDADDSFPAFCRGWSDRWRRASDGAARVAECVQTAVTVLLARVGSWRDVFTSTGGGGGSGGGTSSSWYGIITRWGEEQSQYGRWVGYSEAWMIAQVEHIRQVWLELYGPEGAAGWGYQMVPFSSDEGSSGGDGGDLLWNTDSTLQIVRRFWVCAGLEAAVAYQWRQVAAGISSWGARWWRPVQPATEWAGMAERVADAWRRCAETLRAWAERTVELVATTTLTGILPESAFHGQAAVGYFGQARRSIVVWMHGSVVTGAEVVAAALEAVRGAA